jgi:hypothetical protein
MEYKNKSGINLQSKGMKRIVIALTISAMFVLQSCYTSKPTGSVTAPDYNKRVSVSNAKMKKKGNGLNVVFTVGLAGAGGYAGYQYLPLVQKQTATGHEPVRAANAAIGALSGAAISYLCDAIMGKNKTNPVVDPQQWIKKANPQYKLLDGSGQYFTLIHPSAERNYTVEAYSDVLDFKKAFPNSAYAENVVNQSITNLEYDATFPALAEFYPQYKDKLEAAYLKNALEKTESFDMFKTKITDFPQCLSDVSLNIDYQNEAQLKTLFAQMDSHSAEFGKERLRAYKNEILDKLAVIQTDIDHEYETAQYEKVPKNTSDYDLLYNFVNRFPNSQYSVNLKTKADNMKYSAYSSLFAQIQEEAATVNAGIVKQNPVSISNLEKLLADYETFSGYDPNHHNTDILAAKSILEKGRSLSAFFDVKNEVNSILIKAQKQEFAYPTDLGGSISKFNNLPNNKADSKMKRYVEDAQKLYKIIDGINLNVPNSYREFSVGGAILGAIGTVISGNVTALNLARPMNTALAEEHLAKVQIIDDIGYFLENNRFGEDELLGHASKYDNDNIWRILGYKLVDKEKEIIGRYNEDANDKITRGLNQWQENINASSSGSSSYSSSSSEDIDPDKVSIPDYTITTNWKDRALLSTYSGDQYLEAEFDDGTEIEISRYNSDKVPFVKQSITAWDKGEYKTDDYAIKAAYVWKKYNKLRTIGKK